MTDVDPSGSAHSATPDASPDASAGDVSVALVNATTLGAALTLATGWLRSVTVGDTPALDAQTLLAHVTGLSRASLLAYPERPLEPERARGYAALVTRRVSGEPVAYLIERREFMGLEFLVDARTLIPRPETELLVEAALRVVDAHLVAQGAPTIVADIGTGSGAIALSLAALRPALARVYATDVSPDALALATENARRLGVADRVSLLLGDLLAPLPEPVDLLLANLPYVASTDPHVGASVRRYEPSLAVFGDEPDGLGHIRRLLGAAPAHIRPGATLFLEFGYNQRAAVEQLAHETFPGAHTRVGADYAGWERFIEIETPPTPQRG